MQFPHEVLGRANFYDFQKMYTFSTFCGNTASLKISGKKRIVGVLAGRRNVLFELYLARRCVSDVPRHVPNDLGGKIFSAIFR